MPIDNNDRGAQLREYLNDAREAILWKCEGLSDGQARTPLTPTGTHVMGLLLHLAVTESQYFISCLGREIENPVIRSVIEAEDAQTAFLPPPNMTLVDTLKIYREATVAADWNSIYGRFADWSRDGTWASVLAAAQAAGQRAGDLDWTVSVDATITRVHQHGAPFPAPQGVPQNYKKLGAEEPGDHAIGKSRGGMRCKIHFATDGRGRPLGRVLTAGQAADTSFFQTVLETISVAGNSRGRPRTRPDRVLADKAYTSSPNRGYLAGRGIKITIPERSDQIAGRVRRGSKGGRPRSFNKEAYKGRNVAERCFSRLKQWRGIATRSEGLATRPSPPG